MAVTPLTVQIIVSGGIVPTYAAITSIPDGFTFANTGKEYLEVVNADANPTTVSVNAVTPCNQGFDHDLSEIVANGTTQKIGPFPVAIYGATVTGALTNITAITVGLFRLP